MTYTIDYTAGTISFNVTDIPYGYYLRIFVRTPSNSIVIDDYWIPYTGATYQSVVYTGLLPNTSYVCNIGYAATTSAGTTWGTSQSFTTPIVRYSISYTNNRLCITPHETQGLYFQTACRLSTTSSVVWSSVQSGDPTGNPYTEWDLVAGRTYVVNIRCGTSAAMTSAVLSESTTFTTPNEGEYKCILDGFFGESIKLPSKSPEKEGQEFEAWLYTPSSGSAVEYKPGTYFYYTSFGNVVLTAKWKSNDGFAWIYTGSATGWKKAYPWIYTGSATGWKKATPWVYTGNSTGWKQCR